MKNGLSYLFVFFALIPSVLVAQTVTIRGNAQGRIFEQVRIKVYADQFSHLKKTVAQTLTDEDGNFSLTFECNNTNYAWLSVELLDGEFYLKPGASYRFDVFPDTATKGSVYDQLPLPFNMTANDDGLNDNLQKFNSMYNTFVMNHFNELYRSRDLSIIFQLRKSIEEEFSAVNNSYFNIYVKYSLAQLEWTSKKRSDKSIIKEYFVDNPIYYNNIQYTDFFHSIFKEYVVQQFYGRFFNQLVKAVYDGSLAEFQDVFLNDSLLASDTALRELVMMQTAFGFYGNPDFSNRGVIKILNRLKNRVKDARHKEIAQNYILRLLHLAPGTPAPEFELPVSSGKTYSPSDFKGQVTVLDFMKTDCRVCLAHLDFLKDLSSRMGSKLKIVMLVYGEYPEKITMLLKQQGLDWPVLYVGKRVDVLDAYDVKIFPTYIILNPDATIGLAPASMADENLENEVQRILRNSTNSR